jgi:hypothetical protein
MKNNRVKKNMEVIGADGVYIGTVDRVTSDRIRLVKNDSGEGRHKGHHHYIDLGLVADIEGQTVRLSAAAATAVTFEEGSVRQADASLASSRTHQATEAHPDIPMRVAPTLLRGWSSVVRIGRFSEETNV